MDIKLQYFNKLAKLLNSFFPQATPELFLWFLVQRESGKSFEQLKNEMVNTGWNPALVDQIILYAREDSQISYNGEGVSNSNLKEQEKTAINKFKSTEINYNNLPGVIFDNYPNRIDVGDKVVDLMLSIDHPRIVLVNDFLSDTECQRLIDISSSRLEKSKTMGYKDYAVPEENDSRTSSGAFLNPKSDPIFKTIDNRISKMVNWDSSKNGEDLHILQYKPGQQYKPHYDYFSREFIAKQKARTGWGQRVGTVLLYLNEVESGGHTIFPDVGISVHPNKGSALFFAYNDDPASLSLHGGAPVVSGIKWVATKWLRAK